MYLNVNLASNATGVGAEGSCTTPRTPEILNLLAGAPFDNVGGGGGGGVGPARSSHAGVASTASATSSAAAASTPGDGPSSPREHAATSTATSSTSSLSPSTSSAPSTPSLQNTRTYLIKEGLKLTIQSKRLASGRLSVDADLSCYPSPKSEEVPLRFSLPVDSLSRSDIQVTTLIDHHRNPVKLSMTSRKTR